MDCRDVLLRAWFGPTDNHLTGVYNCCDTFGLHHSTRVTGSELAEHQTLDWGWLEDPFPILALGFVLRIRLYTRSVLKCLDFPEPHPFTKPIALRHRVRSDPSADLDGHMASRAR